MKKYGIFTYSLHGESERPLCITTRATKQAAINLAVKQCSTDYENTFTEVWEVDEIGTYGNVGIPVWCTKTSGYFDAVVKANEEKKRQKYFA